jgi:hypothetical protein
MECDILIIGGGFFGCSLATYFKQFYEHIIVIEMSGDIMQRASYANQARVHNGYHYPRSILTALRSRVNFPRFIKDYPECIDRDFEKYYGVGKIFSKVSANQFRLFMERIGAEILPAPEKIKTLFNPGLVEDVFQVREYAFDAVKLKERVWQDIHQSKVEVRLNSKVEKILLNQDGKLGVICTDLNDGIEFEINAKKVFNCTYAHINQILINSGLPSIPLKHEVTEMALIKLPDELKNLGVTVMCGPFFSFMPFPPLGLHTLSHVRYTPHQYWLDDNPNAYIDSYQYLQDYPKKSNFTHMIKDTQRYIPPISLATYVDSLWEIKTVLPQSEVDDSRPILLKKDYGLPGLTCIMGGKIDNIYDVFAEYESLRAE